MYKKFLWVFALAFSFVLSQTAFADGWSCGKGLKEMVESLKLDDAQKAKIKPVLEQLKSSMKESWTPMKDLESKIEEQTNSDKMDQGTVDGLVDQKTKLLGNMMKAKIMAKNQILAILTPKQKSELQQMFKKKEEKIEAQFKNCHKKD